jgi:hypothetical protein
MSAVIQRLRESRDSESRSGPTHIAAKMLAGLAAVVSAVIMSWGDGFY